MSLWMGIVVLAAGCGRNLDPTCGQKEVDVSFDMDATQSMTKAYGDGMTVNTLHVYAYLVDPDTGSLAYIDPASHGKNCPSQTLGMIGGKASYSTRLVTGQKYVIVFWADYQSDGYASPYTYDNATHTISVKDHNPQVSAVPANDERRDAFYAVETIAVSGAIGGRTVHLKRPFAQLNYGLSAADKALADAVSPIAKSSVKLDDVVYTKLNLFDGSVSAPLSSVTFTSAPILAEPLTVKAEGASAPVEYTYLSMNYILVNQDVVPNTTLTLYGADDAVVATVPVSQVPLKRNYRTNIVGNLISSPATINIVVDPAYEVPENNVSK